MPDGAVASSCGADPFCAMLSTLSDGRVQRIVACLELSVQQSTKGNDITETSDPSIGPSVPAPSAGLDQQQSFSAHVEPRPAIECLITVYCLGGNSQPIYT
ncbi:UNVERIFIED_CONTAM: hypothetical protein FKN15_036058 [Acipenser sinensis]